MKYVENVKQSIKWQKMQIKHTTGPNMIKPGEPAGPGATEMRQETTTYVSEHLTMTTTKETFDPTTEPPSNLPEGATYVHHDSDISTTLDRVN